MSERAWTTEQQQSIDARGGTLLVSAAAGSGKTAVLVERIFHRILGSADAPPVDVDRLLVVTFTRAAAAEMKQRLFERLTRAAADAAPADRVRLRRQLLRLPFAQITTIDGFCSWLVRDHASLLNLPPDFKVIDAAPADLLWNAAVTEELERRYAAGEAGFLRLANSLVSGKSDRVLVEAVGTLHTFLQSLPYPEEWMARQQSALSDSRPIEQTPWFESQRQAACRHCRAALDKADRLDALLAQYPDLAPLYESVPGLDRAVVTACQGALETRDLPWKTLRDTLEQSGFATLPRRPKGMEETPAMVTFKLIRDDLKKELNAAKKSLTITPERLQADRRLAAPMVAELFDLVAAADAAFSEKKRAARSLDFSDLARQALRLLIVREDGVSRPTDMADALHEQFEEIMVDEYQDVNELQDALFTALSREEQNLFFVGDVKQSIYAFRKARPELFLERLRTFAPYDGEAYPAAILLKENFRSRPQVTDAVNYVCSQLFSPEVGGLIYGEDEALVPHRTPTDDGSYDTTLLVVDAEKMAGGDPDDDDADGGAVSATEAEAAAIAQEIRAMVDGGMLITQKDGTDRPAEYGDFCILLRSFSHYAPVYESALARFGIPAHVKGTGDLFATPEIRLMMSLLQCIDNPLRDVPMLAVLMSPVYGFTPDDLAQIRLRDRRRHLYVSLKKIALGDSPLSERCAAFLREMESFRLLAATVPVDRLIRQIFETTDLLHLMAVRTDGAGRVANLHLFYEKAHSFEENRFRGLSAFLRYCTRLRDQVEVETASIGDQRNAVRILSVHKSKGLEFPVVFAAGLVTKFVHTSTDGPLLLHPEAGVGLRLIDPDTLVRHETLFYTHVKQAIQQDEKSEALRLLYVAMTRAREKLVLVTTLKEPQKTLQAVAESVRSDAPGLPPAVVLKAGSFQDWVLRAAFRHPNAAPLRELAGVSEDFPLLPASYPWQVKVVDAAVSACEVAAEAPVASEPDEAFLQKLTDRFAYEYPYRALGQVPGKLAVSDVAHRDLSRAYVATARPAILNRGELTPAQRGTALHTFLQYADWPAAAADPARERTRLVERGFLTRQQADAVDLRRVQTFFESELYRRIARADRLWREIPFTIELPLTALDVSAEAVDTLPPDARGETMLVQGIADCVFEENGELVIVDYKTDRVSGGEVLLERYARQLQLYALALGQTLGRPVRECLIYSFALGRTFGVPPRTCGEHFAHTVD